MPAPLLVGPALYGAGLISGGLKAAAGAAGLGGAYAALRGMGVNPFSGGAGNMYERRGLTPPPPPPRRPMYGPAFGNTPNTGRVGGGNAGASTAAQWPASLKGPGSAAPGQRTTPIAANFSGGSRAAVAIQNAAQGAKVGGLGVAAPAPAAPAWSWGDNPAMRDAAMTAGRAAAAARGDTVGDNGMISQRGGGYLSRDQLPAASNPANDAYWARADMNAWANANKALAARQGWVEGRDYNAANTAGGQWQTPSNLQAEQAILQGQAAGIFDRPGVTANTPEAEEAILAAQSAGVLGRMPMGQESLREAHAIDPVSYREVPSFEAARQESLREAHAIDPVAPAVAPPAQDPAARMVPAQMPSTGDSAGDLAQGLNRSFLEAIKDGLRPGDEPGLPGLNPWTNSAYQYPGPRLF